MKKRQKKAKETPEESRLNELHKECIDLLRDEGSRAVVRRFCNLINWAMVE